MGTDVKKSAVNVEEQYKVSCKHPAACCENALIRTHECVFALCEPCKLARLKEQAMAATKEAAETNETAIIEQEASRHSSRHRTPRNLD